MKILTKENTKDSLEDRIVYVLSEWLDDLSPLRQERYREPARSVMREIEEFSKRKKRKKK